MSIYPTKSLIQSEELQTVRELIAELEKFKTRGVNYIEVSVTTQDEHIQISDAVFSLELLERTFSDGSKGHDIQINFHEVV